MFYRKVGPSLNTSYDAKLSLKYVTLFGILGCGPNEEFSNHTLCEHTCANRLDGPPENCEEKLKDGCVCEDEYYRDENGDCVRLEECERCLIGKNEYREVINVASCMFFKFFF